MSNFFSLNSDNLMNIRHAVRDALSAQRHECAMGHVSEAVASGFGSVTHAALLARLAASGGTLEHVAFDRDGAAVRLSVLSGIAVTEAADAVRAGLDVYASQNLLAAARSPEPSALPPIDWKRSGRMISGSKSGYRMEFPDNLVVFNALVYTRSSGQVWCGDLDVTRDAAALCKLAAGIREDVYILHESAGWNFHAPRDPDARREFAAELGVDPEDLTDDFDSWPREVKVALLLPKAVAVATSHGLLESEESAMRLRR